MAEEIKRKSCSGHLLKAAGEDGVVEAIVNVFGLVDSYNERTVQGCFAESLNAGLPKCVWMHDWSEPIAKTIEAKELGPGSLLLPDELKEHGGLYCKWQFFKEIDDSWQAYLKIKAGFVDEYSIGYRLLQYTVDKETNVWDLLKCKLIESGPVLKGACPGTQTLNVKTDLMGNPQYGMSIEEHTEILLKRIEKRFQDRESEDTLTDGFVNRLRETGDKIVALADSAKARDAAAPEVQATTIGDLDWEASKHAMRMRAIRSKAS